MRKRDASEAMGALSCGRGAHVMPTGAHVRSIGVSVCEERPIGPGAPTCNRGAPMKVIGVPPCERRAPLKYIGIHCRRKGGAPLMAMGRFVLSLSGIMKRGSLGSD